jgi:hypothetical protein
LILRTCCLYQENGWVLASVHGNTCKLRVRVRVRVRARVRARVRVRVRARARVRVTKPYFLVFVMG